jgi:hypothetical protein
LSDVASDTQKEEKEHLQTTSVCEVHIAVFSFAQNVPYLLAVPSAFKECHPGEVD